MKTNIKNKHLKLLCGTALLTTLLSLGHVASADTWIANSPESIQIEAGQTSYTLKKGDTLWAVSQVVDIDVNVLAQLSDVDLARGQQYKLPVGYLVKWNEDKSSITLTDEAGIVQKELERVENGSYKEVIVKTESPSTFEELAERVERIEFKDGVSHVILKDGYSMVEFANDMKSLVETEIGADKHSTLSEEDNQALPVQDDFVSPVEETTAGSSETTDISSVEEGTKTEEVVDTSGADKIHFLRRFNEMSDMILIESNGLYGLVDVGYRKSATRDYAIDYLKKQGVSELEFIWVSHYDEDHIVSIDAYTGGTQTNGDVLRTDTAVLDNFTVKQVYLPQNITGAGYEKNYVARIQKTLDERGISYTTEGNFQIGDFVMTTYNDKPFTEEEKAYNNGSRKANYSSRALLVEKDNYDVLLSGDIEAYDEKTLGKEVVADTGTVDVFKAGHHGLSTSNTTEYLEELDPQAIVVTGTKSMNSSAEQENLESQAPTYWTGSDTVVVDMTDTTKGITVGNTTTTYQTITNDSQEGTRLDSEVDTETTATSNEGTDTIQP